MISVKTLKNFATSKASRKVLVAQKHSPTIMVAVASVGVVATAVLASRATLKAQPILAQAKADVEMTKQALAEKPDEYNAIDQKRDHGVIAGRTIVAMAKVYIPTILVGATTIALFTTSHVMMNRRVIGLTAAYSALDKGYREYRQRIIEEFGEDRERELRFPNEKISEKVVDDEGHSKNVTKTVVQKHTPSMYARFFDEMNPNWEKQHDYNLMFLRTQEAYMNDVLRARGHVLLNDVYDALGMERTPAGAVVGWIAGEGDDYVDFGVFDSDNERARDFVNGREKAILLDFNVDGVVYEKI